VARQIHMNSARNGAPFVVLNCASMHPERMEAELFGVEGTGEDHKVGILEQAHGGTLLLDEVCDMPIETQGKILRVLQDQTFERLGGTEPVQVDVRVIATTGKSLKDEIAAGNFREDLYYRLNVVPIDVPPLRQRRADIPDLVENLMATAAASAGRAPQTISPDAMAALQGYDWPGNVRQLSNIVDWLLIMHPNETAEITVAMLPPEISGAESTMPRTERASAVMMLPLREARESFERDYLAAQVERFGGNISRTAEFVGMERSALHRKLRLLGVASSGRGT
jgi:two-component system nitrogen regulation response regulator NtrX